MVRFHSEQIEMPSIDEGKIVAWMEKVANSFNKSIGDVQYLICTDEKMLEYNNLHLNHDYYTDIITFDYSQNPYISGDIYIGLETVMSNAALLKKPFQEEFYRVLIHGILHLCGLKDKEAKDEIRMREEEDKALSMLIY